MSEKGWLAAQNVSDLWREGPRRERAKPRKVRLWACACARQLWEYLPDERSRRAVEVAELFADGFATEKDCDAAHQQASNATRQFDVANTGIEQVHYRAAVVAGWAISPALLTLPNQVSTHAVLAVGTLAAIQKLEEASDPDAGEFPEERAARLAHADLLRDVVGNPFRRVKVKPAWLTDTVRALAASMYESREFSAMPILADALQDAGCDNEDILSHCRGNGPHVRGCWVVDLLLGKK